MFKHVLVPTDGSDLSMQAVEHGVALARAIGARVTVLTVVEPFAVLGTDSRRIAATRKAHHRYARNQADHALEEAAREAKRRGVLCATIQEEGEQPYQTIIEAATKGECDLIVMASHGRRGVAALVLGSETHKVLIHSSIPVLVYR
ncbi:MAG: universal stress protein [Hyphomicrobiaceae bacterium]